jgi:lysophospholipase L1-like esterase
MRDKASVVVIRALLVISLMVRFSSPVASAAPILRVMPLGDSITDGYPIPGGYRAMLYQLLTNAGYNLDFVGTMTDNGVASLPDPDHEGHPGYRIDQIAAGFTNWVQSVNSPDVILLLIGTNDYGQNYDTTNATNRLDQLISEIAALRPKSRIVVANLLQRTDNPAADAAIQATFNPYVPGIVANHAALGQLVYFLDMRSALGPSDLTDGLHPNQTGYNKMATNWFGVVRKIIASNVANGQLVNFDGASINGALNLTAIPSIYQPIPGLTLGYGNVGIYNGGPDHTTGITGSNHYSTYAASGDNGVMVYTFSRPVSLPSLWLTTFNGGGLPVNINVYSDTGGSALLGTVSFNTALHSGPGTYAWLQCTNLNDPAFNGMIRRVEFSVVGSKSPIG